jgi:hypothetical protein
MAISQARIASRRIGNMVFTGLCVVLTAVALVFLVAACATPSSARC